MISTLHSNLQQLGFVAVSTPAEGGSNDGESWLWVLSTGAVCI